MKNFNNTLSSQALHHFPINRNIIKIYHLIANRAHERIAGFTLANCLFQFEALSMLALHRACGNLHHLSRYWAAYWWLLGRMESSFQRIWYQHRIRNLCNCSDYKAVPLSLALHGELEQPVRSSINYARQVDIPLVGWEVWREYETFAWPHRQRGRKSGPRGRNRLKYNPLMRNWWSIYYVREVLRLRTNKKRPKQKRWLNVFARKPETEFEHDEMIVR